MNNKSPIQNRIAALRTVRNISQEALADELSIECTYLSKVERGKVTPSGALMASVLDVSYRVLCGIARKLTGFFLAVMKI